MAALPEDPYEILGVAKDAQIAEIRSAHRKLVLKCHPDKVQDPALKVQKQDEFQKVQQAYELLIDDKERQKYDEQVKLAELRKQMANATTSSSRSSSKPTEYAVRTPEARPASYQPGGGVPPVTKTYAYSQAWDDDLAHSPRIFEPASSRSSRRETKYTDSRSKHDSDRERERSKEARERERARLEKERERERRKKAAEKSDKEDSARRSEKDARSAERKARDKVRERDPKRDSDDKKKKQQQQQQQQPHSKPYIEEFSDGTSSKSPKKKSSSSSSRSYEEKRDRSASADDVPHATRTFPEYATSSYDSPRVPPASEPTWSQSIDLKSSYAASYIEATRANVPNSGLKRSMTYHPRMDQPPAAPTPPPASSQASPFSPPEDQEDGRWSSGRPRRGSTESNRVQREKSYRKSSREPLDETVPSSSPSTRQAPQFQRATTAAAPTSGSPPQVSRTNSMPPDASYVRSMPIRSQTFSGYPEPADGRGRHRSRMQPQINEESDSEEAFDARTRDRTYRGNRTNRSPEALYTEARYAYDPRQGNSYSRRQEAEAEAAYYYSGSGRTSESRPTVPSRDASYSVSSGSAHFARVKTSKSYGVEDIQYTHHQKPREVYPAY
ncbi:Chaperone protein DnaJ [Escovopsis weberi]|uniref:Chaperone protein DnaJ n=1 Tax=Escovopsis weberi TaxID=150374 RepID=A0A0M8N0P4_ESCWE|nr:Chaperone protein DnaJ [Escovopsis weberi]